MAHVGRALVKLRLDAEKPREVPYAEKKRRMVEHVKSRMDEMCCAQLPDGTEECAAKYCIIHVKRTMAKRATHVARKMTEANHPKAVEHFDVATQATGPHTRALPIPRAQPPTGALLICATQMSMDVVNPDLHPDPACRVQQPLERRGNGWSAWASPSCTTRPSSTATTPRRCRPSSTS